MTTRWVCLDIGETLVDETRVWATWADVLGIPAFTFAACFGGVMARGGDLADLLDGLLAVPGWAGREAEVRARYGAFRDGDLYPDARRAIAGLSRAGYRVAVMGNQPARRHAELHDLGIRPDAMAMSDELGVAKPDPAFFAAVLARMGDPEPGAVAYVGDRIDNDVIPARRAGLRSVWIRRGPWSLLAAPTAAADLVVDSLDELVDHVARVF